MPAVSKAQQKFMGMVHAAQKGDMENPSPEVSKAADSMSDKDAKDFASTSHKGLPDKKTEQINKLKEIIRNMIRERMIDEMNTTGGVEGYNTPFAFSGKDSEAKKGKKQADLTGYTVVNEETVPINKLKQKMPNHVKSWAKYVAQHEDGEWWFYDDTPKLVPGVGWKSYDSDGHQWSSDVKTNSKNWEKSSQKLNENRWRDIKNEEAPATTKVNKGIANINHQLAEIEKFLGWYGKLKAENGVNNGNFWKRTNNHIYTIKERLLNLERQVRKISE